jgi:hypothetical protein
MKRRTAPEGRSSRRAQSILAALDVKPIGLHPFDRCAWCGADAETAPLYLTEAVWTRAPAAFCEDTLGCARRREVARRVA